MTMRYTIEPVKIPPQEDAIPTCVVSVLQMYNIAETFLETEKAKVITKKQNFQHVNGELWLCNVVFIFRVSFIRKEFLLFQKPYCLRFSNLNNFFGISDIENRKTTLHSQSSSFYVVKISFLTYDFILFGCFPSKIVFAMLYIYKTEPTHEGVASS